MSGDPHTPIPAPVVAALIDLPGVLAVGLAGSRATGLADEHSDTDLYALHNGAPPPRHLRAAALGPHADRGLVEHEDAWGEDDRFHRDGRLVEVMYLGLDGIDLDAFERGDVSPNGYTTAFLFTLARMEPLADPHGHLARLRQRLATYPEATRDRLLDRLPRELPNYLDQLRKAQRRRDWTGVINRRSALQEAWFDLLFAINRHYHPGEKRLLSHLAELPLQPPDAVQRWSEAALAPGDDPGLVDLLTELTDDLLDLCRNR